MPDGIRHLRNNVVSGAGRLSRACLGAFRFGSLSRWRLDEELLTRFSSAEGCRLLTAAAGSVALFCRESLVCGTFCVFVGAGLLVACASDSGWLADLLRSLLPAIPGLPAQMPSPPTAVAFTLCGAGIALPGLRLRPSRHRLVIWVFGSLGAPPASAAPLEETVGGSPPTDDPSFLARLHML